MDTSGFSPDMGVLAGILFHMGAFNIDPEDFPIIELYVYIPVMGDGLIVLGNLVGLSQVRIEIVFAREPTERRNFAVERQANLDRVFYGSLIGYRKGSGQTHRNRGYPGVGFAERRVGGAIKHFGFSA